MENKLWKTDEKPWEWTEPVRHCENCNAKNGELMKDEETVLCPPCQEAILKSNADYEIVTGSWDGEPIVRPMTVAERYFKKLHLRDEDHDHKETCTCNV